MGSSSTNLSPPNRLTREQQRQLFLSLPRPVLDHYFALADGIRSGARSEMALSELRALIDALAKDFRTAATIKEWESSPASGELSRGAEIWALVQQLARGPEVQDLGALLLHVEALWIELLPLLQADQRLKDVNPKAIKSQETALFCIRHLVAHTEQLSPAARTQFRRAERIEFCRAEAQRAGREDLVSFMTANLFTERVIPEVTRQLLARGLYVRPRRPRKENKR